MAETLPTLALEGGGCASACVQRSTQSRNDRARSCWSCSVQVLPKFRSVESTLAERHVTSSSCLCAHYSNKLQNRRCATAHAAVAHAQRCTRSSGMSKVGLVPSLKQSWTVSTQVRHHPQPRCRSVGAALLLHGVRQILALGRAAAQSATVSVSPPHRIGLPAPSPLPNHTPPLPT